MKVKILKVRKDEFLIGQEVPKSKVYTNCLDIIMTPQEDGGIQVGFAAIMHPFSSSRKGCDIEKDKILATADCPIGVINSYVDVISMGDPV